MGKEKIVFKDLAYKIIGIAMRVHNELGHGFLEKVYENAMMVMLRKEGIKASQQAAIAVRFLGEYSGRLLRRHLS
jgi:GxxExxY protein